MSSRESLHGTIAAKNTIIRSFEEAIENGEGFLHVRDQLYFSIGEAPPNLEIEPVRHVNKTEFIDSFKTTIKEYLASLEETGSGKVKKSDDYVDKQLEMLSKELNQRNDSIGEE